MIAGLPRRKAPHVARRYTVVLFSPSRLQYSSLSKLVVSSRLVSLYSFTVLNTNPLCSLNLSIEGELVASFPPSHDHVVRDRTNSR